MSGVMFGGSKERIKVTAGSIRTAFAACFVALVLLSGIAAGPLAPRSAEAATTVNVKACFYWAETGAAYANYPVTLKNRVGNTVRSGKTGADGCATFYGVAGNSIYYFQAHLVLRNSNGVPYAVFLGESPASRVGSAGTWTWNAWVPVYRVA